MISSMVAVVWLTDEAVCAALEVPCAVAAMISLVEETRMLISSCTSEFILRRFSTILWNEFFRAPTSSVRSLNGALTVRSPSEMRSASPEMSMRGSAMARPSDMVMTMPTNSAMIASAAKMRVVSTDFRSASTICDCASFCSSPANSCRAARIFR